MAFNKNNNKNNRNNNNNYFTQQIQQDGTNFLASRNAYQIQQAAPRIFRELAQGRIDIEKNLEYFKNIYFLNNCIDYATKKYDYYNISRFAVQTLIDNRKMYGPVFTEIELNTHEAIFNEHQVQEKAYQVIMNHLLLFRQNVENPNPLYAMRRILNEQYRNVL